MDATFMLCVVGLFLLVGLVFVASAIRIVQQDTRLSVYRLGRYLGDKGPGIVILIPFIDRGVLKKVEDMDTTSGRQTDDLRDQV